MQRYLVKKNLQLNHFFLKKTILGLKDRILKHHTYPLNILSQTLLLVVLLINPCGRDVNIPGYLLFKEIPPFMFTKDT